MPAVEIIRRQAMTSYVIQNADALKGKLLDVGCGSQPYKPLLEGVSEVTGLDIRPVGEIEADMCAIPLDDESFDTVMSIDSLNFTDDPKKAIGEMVRVLKPGGTLLIIVRTTAEDDSVFLGIHTAWLHKVLQEHGLSLYDSNQTRSQTMAGLFSRAEADNFWTNHTWLEGIGNGDLDRFTQYLDRRYPAIAGVVARKEE